MTESQPNDQLTALPDIILALERKLVEEGEPQVDDVIQALDDAIEFCKAGGLLERGTAKKTVEHFYTRFAAALTAFATHPSTKLTSATLDAICRRKQIIAYIFAASGYRSMRHLAPIMSDPKPEGGFAIKLDRAAVLLAFLSLDDVTDELMDVALRQAPPILFRLTLGWLNQRAVLTAQGEKNRGRLLVSGNLFKDLEIVDTDLQQMINAWMYSSYATEPRKHEIKRSFNQLLAARLRAAGVRPACISYVHKHRPTMLVIHERFIAAHAMFRCYAPLIEQLRSKFRLVALCDEAWIDDASEALFEQIVKLPKQRTNVSQIVEKINAIAPDVIYYPSLGMSHWTVMVAQLRLAPIQIASLGHPATTMIENIDYVYTPRMEGDLSQVFSERVLVGESGELFEAHSEIDDDLPALVEPSSREVRIAVNSKVMKLSYRLIEICKALTQAAPIPLTFWFFPGERGLFYDGLQAAIAKEIPNSKVFKYTNYKYFLSQIAQCDFALSAFPFGNTNSTVDTALLGLPNIAHFGPECPAQSDKRVLETAGLPTWVVCESDQEFYDLAMEFITDPDKRKSAIGGLSREQIRSNLLGNKRAQTENNFGDVFYQVYCNHDAIQRSDERVWTHSQLVALTASELETPKDDSGD